MPMAADDIAAMIRAAIPDATVEITDGRGRRSLCRARYRRQLCGDEPGRTDSRRLCRARRAHGGELHALQLTTAVPADAATA